MSGICSHLAAEKTRSKINLRLKLFSKKVIFIVAKVLGKPLFAILATDIKSQF